MKREIIFRVVAMNKETASLGNHCYACNQWA